MTLFRGCILFKEIVSIFCLKKQSGIKTGFVLCTPFQVKTFKPFPIYVCPCIMLNKIKLSSHYTLSLSSKTYPGQVKFRSQYRLSRWESSLQVYYSQRINCLGVSRADLVFPERETLDTKGHGEQNTNSLVRKIILS